VSALGRLRLSKVATVWAWAAVRAAIAKIVSVNLRIKIGLKQLINAATEKFQIQKKSRHHEEAAPSLTCAFLPESSDKFPISSG
jgi:hypothetical protein